MLSETKHPCIAILSFNEEEQAVIAEATRSYNIEPIFASTIHDLRNIILEKRHSSFYRFSDRHGSIRKKHYTSNRKSLSRGANTLAQNKFRIRPYWVQKQGPGDSH